MAALSGSHRGKVKQFHEGLSNYDWGRDLFAAVRSVVNTGKRHGLSAFQAIQRALSPVGSLFDPG
jgi:hypothetical protein